MVFCTSKWYQIVVNVLDIIFDDIMWRNQLVPPTFIITLNFMKNTEMDWHHTKWNKKYPGNISASRIGQEKTDIISRVSFLGYINSAIFKCTTLWKGTVEDRLSGSLNAGSIQTMELLYKNIFMIIHFLNHVTVINEEWFDIFILNNIFSKIYMLFKLVYFLPYLTC
jgi:hypothetical protein